MLSGYTFKAWDAIRNVVKGLSVFGEDRDGSLEELNRALCAKIRAGEMGLETAGLVEHLWDTTLAKVAIDQPKYAAYKRALSHRRDAPEG